MKHKAMSLKKRFEELQALIRDAIELEFNALLVEGYQKQLNEVKEEIERIQEQRKEFLQRVKKSK